MFTNVRRLLRCKMTMCSSGALNRNPHHFYYSYLGARLGAQRRCTAAGPLLWCNPHVGCGRCGTAQHVPCGQILTCSILCALLLCPYSAAARPLGAADHLPKGPRLAMSFSVMP